jgi:hypothetical protein
VVGRARTDVRRHQVRGDVARLDDAERQLCDLAQGTNRRNIRFTGRARCDDHQQERGKDGDESHPPHNVKQEVPEPHGQAAKEHEPDDEPGTRHLDPLHHV